MVVEIAVYQVLQKIHVGELDNHRSGLEHANQPLEGM